MRSCSGRCLPEGEEPLAVRTRGSARRSAGDLEESSLLRRLRRSAAAIVPRSGASVNFASGLGKRKPNHSCSNHRRGEFRAPPGAVSLPDGVTVGVRMPRRGKRFWSSRVQRNRLPGPSPAQRRSGCRCLPLIRETSASRRHCVVGGRVCCGDRPWARRRENTSSGSFFSPKEGLQAAALFVSISGCRPRLTPWRYIRITTSDPARKMLRLPPARDSPSARPTCRVCREKHGNRCKRR
jgi:hypothetical protein